LEEYVTRESIEIEIIKETDKKAPIFPTKSVCTYFNLENTMRGLTTTMPIENG
jgi:hypothetical protein